MSQLTTVKADDCLYSAILKACTVAKDLGAGKEVHAHILASSKKPDKYVEAGLVYMYAKCGSIHDARRLFDKLPRRNLLAWNAMIAGYAQRGMGQEALSLYRNMQQEDLSPNSVTYVCLLQACASVGAGALGEAKQLHARIEKRGLQQNAILSGSLINMYAKCGSLEQARDMFEKLSIRDVIIWTALIAGYSQRGMGQEALSLYSRMQQEGLTPPDAVTYVCLLQACANVGGGALDEGKQLHAKIIERGLEEDMVVGGSLVNMYAKCGGLEEARTVFDKLPNKHVVTWTALISGYAQQGFGEEALTLYGSMQQKGLTFPDSVTYVCLLQACASVGAQGLDKGKQLHTQIRQEGLECDQVLGGSLVNMYAKCGSLEEARVVFDKLSNRGVVTWTTMIAGYAQEGMGHEALSLYTSMQQDGLTPPDSVTYTCLLHACAAVAALPLGEQLHAEIEERGMPADGSVGAALVNMYAKCGSMNASQQVFDSLNERSIEAWSALVGGYASQGESEVVFDLLERMRSEGVNPDEITFLSVLTVCSHVGLVDKGRKYFEAMRTDYSISATMEHYICMVDLLGRAGHLDEALHMAKTMPFPPNDVLWRALLGSCRKWKNVEIGQRAFEGAISVAARDAASYVMMSNIYASAQMWEAAEEMQAQAMRLGAWKKPGQSWCADVGGVLHTFIVGDKKGTENAGHLCTTDLATCNKEQSIYALPRFVVRHDSTNSLSSLTLRTTRRAMVKTCLQMTHHPLLTPVYQQVSQLASKVSGLGHLNCAEESVLTWLFVTARCSIYI